jgi:hypothetical protein
VRFLMGRSVGGGTAAVVRPRDVANVTEVTHT